MQSLPPPAPRRPAISKVTKADIHISCISVVSASVEGGPRDSQYLHFNVSVTARPGAVLGEHSPSYRVYAYESSGRAVGRAQVGASLFAGLRVHLSDVPQHGGLFVALYCENQLQDAVPVLAAPAAAVQELQQRFEHRVQEQQVLQEEHGFPQSFAAAGHAAGSANVGKEVWQRDFRGLMADLGFVMNAHTVQPDPTGASESSSGFGANLLSRVRLSAVAAAAAPTGVPLANVLHPEPATVAAVAERLLHALQMHGCETTRQLVMNHLDRLQSLWPAGTGSSAVPAHGSMQQQNQPQTRSGDLDMGSSSAQQESVLPVFRTAAAQTISTAASTATGSSLQRDVSTRHGAAAAAAPAGVESDPASSSSSSIATAGLPAGFNAADMVVQLLSGVTSAAGAADTGGWSSSSEDDGDDEYEAERKEQRTLAGPSQLSRRQHTAAPATPPAHPTGQPGRGVSHLTPGTAAGGVTTPPTSHPATDCQATAAGRQHSSAAQLAQCGQVSSRQGGASSLSAPTAMAACGPHRVPHAKEAGSGMPKSLQQPQLQPAVRGGSTQHMMRGSRGRRSSTAGGEVQAQQLDELATGSTSARSTSSSSTTEHASQPPSAFGPLAPCSSSSSRVVAHQSQAAAGAPVSSAVSSSSTGLLPNLPASAQTAPADVLPLQLQEGAGPIPFVLAAASSLVCILLMPSTQELLQQEWLKLTEYAAAAAGGGGALWQWLLQLGVPLQLLEASDPGLLLCFAAALLVTLLLGVVFGCRLAARQQ